MLKSGNSDYPHSYLAGGTSVAQSGLALVLYFVSPEGDTNVHSVAAILDKRVPGRVYLRLLSIGLYPGPREGGLYCHYPCPLAVGGYCTAPVHGVLLLAANHSAYPPGKELKAQ